MSPKPTLSIAARLPKPDAEARIRELEARAEAMGNGVAGQASSADVQRQTSSPDVQPSAVVRRRGGRLRRRRTLYLPPDLDARLATFCGERGREVSETIAEAVAIYLAR